MQTDQLLSQWKLAKQICQKIITIAKNAHLAPRQEQASKQSNDLNSPINSKEYLMVYEVVYHLCVTKEKEQTRVLMVYRQYKQILKVALTDMCQQLRHEKDVYKLSLVRRIWQAYCDIQKRLVHLFAYLNRPFHVKDGKIEDLDRTGVNIVLSTLLCEQLNEQYQQIYFRELQRIRKTQDYSNETILAGQVDILYRLHLQLARNGNLRVRTIYTEFHAQYLKMAREYYQRKYKLLKELAPADYFNEINALYTRQMRVAAGCYGVAREGLINKEFAAELVQKYRPILLTSPKGLKCILKNRQLDILKVIVELNLRLTHNIEGFRQQFEQFVYEEMRAHIEDTKNEIVLKKNTTTCTNFIRKLILKNNEFVALLEEETMQQLGHFANYYRCSVEKAFSTAQLPVPLESVLAVYVDNKLRGDAISQDQMEQQIKSIISLFICLQNKDLFMLKYSQKLSRRIISMSHEGLKHHELLINNLRLKYFELIQLRNEIHLADLNVNHLQREPQFIRILEREHVNIGINLRIFNEDIWPTKNALELPIEFYPPQIGQVYNCLQMYRDEYYQRKSLKLSALESKIRWIYYFHKEAQSMRPLQCYFDTNCLQAALLYFVYHSRPEFVDLAVILMRFEKVNRKLVLQNINKLSDQHDGLLIKFQQEEHTAYQFNSCMRYTRRLLSFELGPIEQEERLFQQQDIGRDRQMILDANIAKFMKSHKVSDFQTLIQEITKMIKLFVPAKRDIKNAIQRLISKELLRRDDNNLSLIKYIE